MVKRWITKPKSVKKYGREAATKQQDRRLAFAVKTLPYMLRKTMHRPIFPFNYSKSSGKVLTPRRNCRGRPVIIEDRGDMDDWLNNKGVFAKCGVAIFTRGFMTLFVELNPTEPIYIGIFDIDIAGPKLEKKARFKVRKIIRILKKKKKFKYLALYTGSSWQVWFRRKDGKALGTYTKVRDKYIESLCLCMGRDCILCNSGTIMSSIELRICHSLDCLWCFSWIFINLFCLPGVESSEECSLRSSVMVACVISV